MRVPRLALMEFLLRLMIWHCTVFPSLLFTAAMLEVVEKEPLAFLHTMPARVLSIGSTLV
jgi:hypothetical protein